jgi:hypothetical protein
MPNCRFQITYRLLMCEVQAQGIWGDRRPRSTAAGVDAELGIPLILDPAFSTEHWSTQMKGVFGGPHSSG